MYYLSLKGVYLVLYRWEGDFVLCGPFFCQKKFFEGLRAVCGPLGEVKRKVDVHGSLGSQEEWIGTKLLEMLLLSESTASSWSSSFPMTSVANGEMGKECLRDSPRKGLSTSPARPAREFRMLVPFMKTPSAPHLLVAHLSWLGEVGREASSLFIREPFMAPCRCSRGCCAFWYSVLTPGSLSVLNFLMSFEAFLF
ncbi:hypothetical protein E2C01_042010 [Portunus trituberculatus]|uniref:Uncharacterized protein n=1 Tax=Portunus trituberculatus TaxID=210409 RepID=A0A5B7FP14_PORTR|nr:hypothetical protein [Portunus trituberculatus]